MRIFTAALFRYLAILVATLFCQCAAAEKLEVIASFSILADMTQRVGGERVQVHALVGHDADAHMYQPTPTDAKSIARARLVVMNGLGFEGWIERLIKASGYRGTVLIASSGIKPLKRHHGKEVKHGHHDHPGDDDPHAWQDISNALRYVDNIAQALSEADPAGKNLYQSNALNYKQELAALDSEVRKTFAAIPPERRKMVTAHGSFGYFGRAYGVAIISPLGVNTDAEASAGDIGRIIQQIRRENISAVFLENISDPRLLERIRQESGARIGGTLYSDSLSKASGPAASYLAMMRHNAKTIAAALAN